tara:strand:- start:66 stop:416 length:351 start_codon:yes stop_codon:yes gene_type:complete
VKLPEWTGSALWGAVAGAIILSIVGFNWGGWVTSSSASKIAKDAANTAVAEALTPYCIAASQADPSLPEISDQLASSGAYLKRGIIEKTGWATPLGSDKSHRQLAEACLIALENES